MKLPADPQDWTIKHAVRAYQEAERKFDEFEAKADFSYEDITVTDMTGLEPTLVIDLQKIISAGRHTELLLADYEYSASIAVQVANCTNVKIRLPYGYDSNGTSEIEAWLR